MDIPKRIQRKRTKGWKMPENTIYVGRPTKWGNPFHVKDFGIEKSIELFRQNIMANESIFVEMELEKLKGKNLACFCKEGSKCHADVLLELANKYPIGF